MYVALKYFVLLKGVCGGATICHGVGPCTKDRGDADGGACQKVRELCDSQGINLAPFAFDVMLRALNPQLVGAQPGGGNGKAAGGDVQAGSPVRLGDTHGKWPVKENKSVLWGEDGELWLMRQLIMWGSNTCDNPRKKAHMNKELVAAMEREFGLAVDCNRVKNKQRDLEETFQNYEKVCKTRKSHGIPRCGTSFNARTPTKRWILKATKGCILQRNTN